VRLRSGAPATDEIPSGCRSHPRCPRYLGAICQEQEPPWRTPTGDAAEVTAGRSTGDAIDHSICCHIPLDELTQLQKVG
jgi:peptide/nickel transport system ATP-binding protein